jgi:hypothetical protein
MTAFLRHKKDVQELILETNSDEAGSSNSNKDTDTNKDTNRQRT